MKDFNFFSPYIETKKESTNKLFHLIIIITVIIGIFSSTFYIFYSKTMVLEKEIITLENYINSKSIIKKAREANIKRNRLKIMKEYYSIVEDINSSLEKSEIIDTYLLKRIASTLPKDLFIKTMSLTKEGLQIQGVANNRVAIAEFEHNLKELEKLTNIHIIRVNKEAENRNNFIFSLIAQFEGVESYESD